VAPLAAAASGEEFELLVTLPASFRTRPPPEFDLTRIGECGRGGGVRLLEGNTPVALPAGYDHFARS
jgi:thiamine monophosphate kinase